MLQSTDGFFSMVTPRLDAVEEITITGAVPGSGAGAGFGSDPVRDPLGLEPDGRQRLSLLAAAGVQHELLLQQDQQAAEERGHRAPVRLPPGRSDRDPGPVRRPRQPVVLLLQLRTPVSAVERDAHAAAAAAGSAGRHLRLQRHRRGRAAAPHGGPHGARAATTARSPRSIRSSSACWTRFAPARATTGTINDVGNGNTLDYVFQAEAIGNQYAPTTRAGLQPSARTIG